MRDDAASEEPRTAISSSSSGVSQLHSTFTPNMVTVECEFPISAVASSVNPRQYLCGRTTAHSPRYNTILPLSLSLSLSLLMKEEDNYKWTCNCTAEEHCAALRGQIQDRRKARACPKRYMQPQICVCVCAYLSRCLSFSEQLIQLHMYNERKREKERKNYFHQLIVVKRKENSTHIHTHPLTHIHPHTNVEKVRVRLSFYYRMSDAPVLNS